MINYTNKHIKMKTLLKHKVEFWEQILITLCEELELLFYSEKNFRNKQAKRCY